MFLPDRRPENHVITEFQPDGSGTLMTMRMTMRMIAADAAPREAMIATGMTGGKEISYARLDDQRAVLTA